MDQSGRGVGVVGPGVQGVLRGVAQTASPLDDGKYHLVDVAVKQSDDVQSGCRNRLAAGDIGAPPTDLIVRQAAGSQDVRVLVRIRIAEDFHAALRVERDAFHDWVIGVQYSHVE